MTLSSNSFLMVFALAFVGCVLSTPLVTQLAVWTGAIDRPDRFRRVHKGAVPRLGGLGLACGLALSLVPVALGYYLQEWDEFAQWWSRQWAVVLAAVIVLAIGVVDDSRGMNPRPKLMGQMLAALVLFAGGVRVESITLMGLTMDFTALAVPLPAGYELTPLSLMITLLWFLGCMNIWNLIDGMDGLASGVGLLVSGTLMLIALHEGNQGAALMAAALAGSLAGFLLYNFHPACIFLGDSGSLLIGLLIGVIGVQYSMSKSSAISILFPILAMGLPVSDTAMAIFRRWVRHLPLSAADRRHVHHILMGLGLNPRQAAVLLYCFTAGLCGVVLLGVAFENEFLALVVGLSGCLAFLLILTSRRDDLAKLRADLRDRLTRGRQERQAAKITWEAIQKIELCDSVPQIWAIVVETTAQLGCDSVRIDCYRQGRLVFRDAIASKPELEPLEWFDQVSGPTATFRLTSGQDLLLAVALHQSACSPMAPDIAFRFLQRLSLATAERLERLLAAHTPKEDATRDLLDDPEHDQPILEPEPEPTDPVASAATRDGPRSDLNLGASPTTWAPLNWLRFFFG